METSLKTIKSNFPRKTKEDKIRLLKLILDEYFSENGAKSLNKITSEYGLAKKLFYEWLDKLDMRADYEALKWSIQVQGRDPAELDEEEKLELRGTEDEKEFLRVFGKFLFHIERGSTAIEAAALSGIKHTTIYYHLSKPHLKMLYEKAKVLRNHTLREQRVEKEIANLELADKAREALLQNRQQKTVTKKKGIEIVGGRPIEVEHTTVQIREVEPDTKMIDLTYKLAGLTKTDAPKVDVNVEVIGSFEEFEVKEIQSDSKQRLMELQKRKARLKEEKKDIEESIDDVDFYEDLE